MPASETMKMTVEKLTEAVAVLVMGWIPDGNDADWYWKTPGMAPSVHHTDWTPSDNASRRDMIVERMRELGFSPYISYHLGWHVTFRKVDFWWAVHDNLGLAVMLAAYEAVTGKRVEVTE